MTDRRHSEIAPGLFVIDFVRAGRILVLKKDNIFMPLGGTVVHPETWNLLSPAKQEEIRDLYIRNASIAGLRLLERYLAEQ